MMQQRRDAGHGCAVPNPAAIEALRYE